MLVHVGLGDGDAVVGLEASQRFLRDSHQLVDFVPDLDAAVWDEWGYVGVEWSP